MPYRHAHWYILAMFPLAGMAFWRSYLSQFGSAGFEFHLHGLTASLWLLLLAMQSWTIHHASRAFHRSAGLASLLLFPLFLAGGAGIFLGMADRFVEGATPFYQLYPARLAWLDVVGVGGMAYFYFQALKHRRKVWLHSGYLLATTIFLLPPMLGRLSPILPGLAINGPDDFVKLGIGFQIANGLTALIALAIALRSKQGRPFFEAAGLILLSAVFFQTIGGMPAWERLYVSMAQVPVLPFTLAAAMAGIVVGWAGWTAGGPRRAQGAIAA